MFKFFRNYNNIKKFISAKTPKYRRVISFFLSIAYLVANWFLIHTVYNTNILGVFSGVVPFENFYKVCVSICTVLLIGSLIIGNAINFSIVTSVNIIGMAIQIVGLVITRNDYCLQELLFYIGMIILSLIFRFYIFKAKTNEASLDNAAYYDTLTKCINRRGLIKWMENKSLIDEPFFLVFLDLDNFKAVNDTLGHESGDELLKFVASKWSDIKAFDKCTLARLGGDEFALTIESGDKTIASHVVKEMFNSIKTGSDLASYVTSSAGIALYPTDTRDIQKLLSYADTAMYKAKTSGKNRYLFFNARMYKEIVDRYNIEKQIKHALEYNQFYLLYQPQFRYGQEKPIGYETLIRMKSESDIEISPLTFISIAEQSGLIFDIDLWVLKHALIETLPLVKREKDLIIAVNLSGKHLSDMNLIEDVTTILNETGFPPANLEFEITESSYINHIDDATLNIHKLKKLGCRLALDDFGTGYSSLSFLTKLQIDIVKIDRTFTIDICNDEEKINFVNVIIQLAHLLKCKVIAEGVETEEQSNKLCELGVDMVQGYYWGKPQKITDTIWCLPSIF